MMSHSAYCCLVALNCLFVYQQGSLCSHSITIIDALPPIRPDRMEAITIED